MCIRELRGSSKVFFDGRYRTVYSESLIDNYFGVLDNELDYEPYLHRFEETDIMLLDRVYPLAASIAQDSNWVEVYSSSIARLFLKNNLKNANAITRFNSGSLRLPQIEPPFYLE